MGVEREASKKGQPAAEGLREAVAKEETKTERNMGHDLPKGADRFDEPLEVPMERAQEQNKKIEQRCYVARQRKRVAPVIRIIAFTFAFVGVPLAAFADTTEWRKYEIPSTGAKVDIPVSIFTEDAGPPEGGTGRRFFTKDRRADITVQSVPNPANDSPAQFLTKKRPPLGIQYKRVTAHFFAVSSVRNGRTWYNRCNRAGGYMNCVLVNYPAAEERQWDGVVTRISLSLAR